MLTIRREQAALLQEVAAQAFVSRLAENLRSQHGDLVSSLSDAELLQRTRRSVALARHYGVCARHAVAKFVILHFMLGPGFDEHPVIRDLLMDPSLAPDLRMEALLGDVPGRVWDEIAASRPNGGPSGRRQVS